MPPRRPSPSPPPPPSSRPPSSRPPPKKRHAHGHRRELGLDTDAIDAALAASVPNARDRAFVIRCIVDEGPRHHRGASWAILRMLAAILVELGGPDAPSLEGEPVPIRLPPNVAPSSEDALFPIALPTRLLGELLTAEELAFAVATLRDGPAHHALANVAMVTLVDAIHRRLKGGR